MSVLSCPVLSCPNHVQHDHHNQHDHHDHHDRGDHDDHGDHEEVESYISWPSLTLKDCDILQTQCSTCLYFNKVEWRLCLEKYDIFNTTNNKDNIFVTWLYLFLEMERKILFSSFSSIDREILICNNGWKKIAKDLKKPWIYKIRVFATTRKLST